MVVVDAYRWSPVCCGNHLDGRQEARGLCHTPRFNDGHPNVLDGDDCGGESEYQFADGLSGGQSTNWG